MPTYRISNTTEEVVGPLAVAEVFNDPSLSPITLEPFSTTEVSTSIENDMREVRGKFQRQVGKFRLGPSDVAVFLQADTPTSGGSNP